MLRAGEAMRLEEHEQAVEFAPTGRFERGTDFRRVMAVIVDDGDVVHHSLDVETAADSGEFCKALANQIGSNGEIQGHCSSGASIADVVHPGGM